MYKLLCPDLVAVSLLSILSEDFARQNVKGIILDLDNTIIPWDSKEMPQEIVHWLQERLNDGFQICLLSNNTKRRVKEIADTLEIPFVYRAFKPAKTGFRKAVEIMNLPPNEVAVIGDQLFTDILGGNRMGLFTIWVSPLANQEFVGTKITRQFERFVIYLLRRKGLLK